MNYRFFILCILTALTTGTFATTSLVEDKPDSDLPSYFSGVFEDKVPKVIGGTVPEMLIDLACSRQVGCKLRFGPQNDVGTFRIAGKVKDLSEARFALSYAKSKKDVPTGSPMAWQANRLMPLLASTAEIDSCVDLEQGEMKNAYMLLCKLTVDPWGKGTVILMGTVLSNCGQLFCRYELFPLFRRTP